MFSRTAAGGSGRLPALCSRAAPLLAPRASICESGRRKMKVRSSAKPERMESIEDLPGPSVSTTLYWLFVEGYAVQSHLLQGVQKRLYGPIWRSRFGHLDIVNVATPELIAQVLQQEGRYPVRAPLSHWQEYRDLRGQAYGLHVETGSEWHRLRSVLNPKMLKLQEAWAFAPAIHQVVTDLLHRIEVLRSRSEDGTTVSDLASELYRFGFEGISSILFETRLGCLQEEIPHDTLRFIAAVNAMLTLSETVLLFPRWTRHVLPFWRRFVQAWDDLYDVAKTLIDRRMAEIEAQVSAGQPAEGLYLTYLLASDKLSRPEVYISVTEMLLGGVDTTSNTLSWALYRLARDRQAQDRLHAEVDSVCPDRREPTMEDVSRMPYLKAVVKETLRLYPVVPGNGRFVSENEVILNNYWFPKKTQFHLCHYAVCHDEAQFSDAESFVPDRWLRAARPHRRFQHHPHSFLPFGVGVRGCVGKRVAEMEMHFLLARLMQRYQVQPEDKALTVEPRTRTLLVPGRPINLRFLDRT